LSAIQPGWLQSTIAFFALTALFFAALQVDSRLLYGVSVWSKPLKFALSLGVYFGTLLVLARLLPVGHLKSGPHHAIAMSLIFVAAFEMVYIAIQAALGEASHFNKTTAFHNVMYSLMGIGAVWLTLGLAWLAVLIAKHNERSDPLVLAVLLGLGISAALGGGFGAYLGGQESHWVDAVPNDANGLWLFNWSNNGGDLRVAHFFGLHAMQIIQMFALVLPRVLWRTTKHTAIVVFSLSYSALCVYTFAQALQGQPFIG
jgi:hypothetical protein